MEKYNKILRNITELVEKGLFASKDIRKEVKETVKLKVEDVVNRLNLVSREEFEVQKKLISKLQKDLIKSKKNK
jgi:BMFP domain-containing protein YqiC